RELQAGATLFLPVFVDGALFSVGDGHGMQGDGEVCSQALEAPLRGRLRLTTRDDLSLTWPMAETDTHIITMAFGDNLDVCARTALRQMIDLLADKVGLSRPDAFTLLSLAGSLRITQMVNINKGVHLMLEKTTVSRDNLLR